MNSSLAKYTLLACVFSFGSCAQDEPLAIDSVEKTSLHSEIMNNWYLVEEIDHRDPQNPDTFHYTQENTFYMLQVLETSCIAYARQEGVEQTFSDTVPYELAASELILPDFDSVGGTIEVAVEDNKMEVIMSYDEKWYYRCIYRKWNGDLPPQDWSPIDNKGLRVLAAFYPHFIIVSLIVTDEASGEE